MEKTVCVKRLPLLLVQRAEWEVIIGAEYGAGTEKNKFGVAWPSNSNLGKTIAKTTSNSQFNAMSNGSNGKSQANSLSPVNFLKLVSLIGMVIMLMDGSMPSALAGETVSNNLSASQIVEKSRRAYSSLSSYSDEGRIVTGIGGSTVTATFTIKLGRPDFYQIVWEQKSDSPSFARQNSIQAVWSSGSGNFLDTEWGTQEQYNRKIALLNAAGLSGGVAASIPMTFSHIKPGDLLGNSAFSAKRQADEKVGGVNCYVITWKSQGKTKTLWVGKQDFLIRQIRTTVSAEAMRAAVAKWDPEIISDIHGYTSIETHTNIIVNQRLSRADFVPSFSTSPPIASD